MSDTVISVENLSKHYPSTALRTSRLGLIGSGTLRDDVARWWATLRGQPDPTLKIGQEEQGNRQDVYIWALRDVSFQVQQGEVLGRVALWARPQRRRQEHPPFDGAQGKCFDPSAGSGHRKLNTSLKILSRVTDPTAGQVKVKGRVASLLEASS